MWREIPHALIPTTGLGTIVIARRVTVGAHTSKTVAKVFNLLIRIFSKNNKKILDQFLKYYVAYFSDTKEKLYIFFHNYLT